MSSIITVVELAGLPRPNSGAGTRVSGPERVAEFLLHMLQNAEGNAEFKSLGCGFSGH